MFDIFQAVRCGEVESVQAAIKQGTDVNMLNKHGENLLIHAIAWKQKDAFELLIKLGKWLRKTDLKIDAVAI